MAFVNDIQGYDATLVSRIAAPFRKIAASYESRRRFDETVRELSALDHFALADLGIARSEIRDVAYQAVYGK